jgi:prepilin-type N-terminal cleavage/methylation domain-containing protein
LPLPSRSRRSGMTLIEILAAIALMSVVMAMAVPTLQGLLDLQQRGAAKDLAQTWSWLRDEATLRNVSFRIAFNLDRGTWRVEVGDPAANVYGSPEEREQAEEEREEQLKRFTKKEIEAGAAEELDEEGGSVDPSSSFTGLESTMVATEQTLPGGCKFLYVYTPQYGEDGMRASEDGPPEDTEQDQIAYAYIFPDGSMEQAIVRIVDDDDEEDGWTVYTEPLNGKVLMDSDQLDPKALNAWLPTEGPQIQ